MSFGWQGQLVRLVPLDVDKHLDNAVLWINDPEVTRFLTYGDFPMTRLAERQWFEETSNSSETNVVFAVETLDGTHLGFSGIHSISWRHGTADTGTVIGKKEEWGKGYGADAAILRTRYAFEVLGLRVLYSGVYEGNDASLAMLKKAGYQESGRRPKRFWKRGAYVDEILLYIDRDMWLQQRNISKS